ncbi:MAG: stage V sporulation protein AD [Clostridia bacterium]|nr:stage V sporulation protein AD [Clostridia bacterium]
MNNGIHTIVYKKQPKVCTWSSVVGPKEGRGQLKDAFDFVMQSPEYNQSSYEAAEQAMLNSAVQICIEKANMHPQQVQAMLGGDLLNQIISTSFTAREMGIPFLGLYGACSTMAESLLLGAMLVDGDYASPVVCTAGSHYCTAERQFRYPLEYGNQRTPAAQWTVTGAGACLLHKNKGNVCITHGTIGKVIDLGVKDANNMGAAMAPAAADTLFRHFCDTGRSPDDYDRIFSGDLGQIGSSLFKQLMKEKAFPLDENIYQDCGNMIFSPEDDVHAGASGCGCSASVLAAHILPRLESGEWKRVLFMATGALMSTVSSQQGESIPGIAHAVVFEHADCKEKG